MYGSQEPVCKQLVSSLYYLKIGNELSCSREKTWIVLMKKHELSYLPCLPHYLKITSSKKRVNHVKTRTCFFLIIVMVFRDQQCHASRQRWHPDKCSDWSKWRTGQTLFQSYLHTYFMLRPALNTLKTTPQSSVFVISTFMNLILLEINKIMK